MNDECARDMRPCDGNQPMADETARGTINNTSAVNENTTSQSRDVNKSVHGEKTPIKYVLVNFEKHKQITINIITNRF